MHSDGAKMHELEGYGSSKCRTIGDTRRQKGPYAVLSKFGIDYVFFKGTRRVQVFAQISAENLLK